jgi:hypothetical protein
MKRSLAFVVVAALALPAAASADDASLFEAYDAPQRPGGAVAELAKTITRHSRRWQRSDASPRWTRALVRDYRRLNPALGVVATALRAEEPSTEDGTRARSLALAEIRHFRAANRVGVRGLQALLRGERKRSLRLIRRAGRIERRQLLPRARRTVRAFAAAGYRSKYGAIAVLTRAER